MLEDERWLHLSSSLAHTPSTRTLAFYRQSEWNFLKPEHVELPLNARKIHHSVSRVSSADLVIIS
jgi:hypothetical protein